jgi:hypothetical protein
MHKQKQAFAQGQGRVAKARNELLGLQMQGIPTSLLHVLRIVPESVIYDLEM